MEENIRKKTEILCYYIILLLNPITIKVKIQNLGKTACQNLVAMEISSHVIKKLTHHNVPRYFLGKVIKFGYDCLNARKQRGHFLPSLTPPTRPNRVNAFVPLFLNILFPLSVSNISSSNSRTIRDPCYLLFLFLQLFQVRGGGRVARDCVLQWGQLCLY